MRELNGLRGAHLRHRVPDRAPLRPAGRPRDDQLVQLDRGFGEPDHDVHVPDPHHVLVDRPVAQHRHPQRGLRAAHADEHEPAVRIREHGAVGSDELDVRAGQWPKRPLGLDDAADRALLRRGARRRGEQNRHRERGSERGFEPASLTHFPASSRDLR